VVVFLAAAAVRVPVALRAVVAAGFLAGAFFAVADFAVLAFFGAAAALVAAGLRPAVLALRVPEVRRLVLTAIGCARPVPVVSLSSLMYWLSLPNRPAPSQGSDEAVSCSI
jgi:hypothetical protein